LSTNPNAYQTLDAILEDISNEKQKRSLEEWLNNFASKALGEGNIAKHSAYKAYANYVSNN